ncbi:MAG TPA: DUF998 domain-containing protein [Cryptosporangiaceae bacterium]|nr:DUF998 domain-containing protein [Cryptosporangiaceae bacterium]
MTRSADPLTAYAEPPGAATPQSARWLALGAVAGPVLFNLTWFVLGFVSPGYTLFGTRIEPYSAISQPFSGLGLGTTAPYMNAAFVLGGLLLIVGVVGVFQTMSASGRPAVRWTCAALLGLSGVGLIIDGIFTLEAVMLHFLGFGLGVVLQVVSFLVTGLFLRGIPHWRRFGNWLLVASPLTLLLVVVFFLTFDPAASGANEGIAGLTERLLVLELHFWFVAMGWLAFRRS